MKKKYGYILGAVIVIIAIITICMVMNKKKDDTVSDDLVNELVSYVPNTYEYNAYMKADAYLNNIDDKILLAMALGNISLKCGNVSFEDAEDNTCLNKEITKEEVTEVLHKMYNVDFPKLNNEEVQVAIYDYNCYNYSDGKFKMDVCNTQNYHNLSKVKNYEVKDDKLIIYEYAAYLISEERVLMRDYQNSTEINGDDFNNNYDKFTLYKHTFKKDSNGYYWLSTEIA